MLRSLPALVASVFLMLPGLAQAAPEVGKPAPDFTAKAADGTDVKLSDYKGKIVVLEWHNPECPFVKKHYGSGNMQKLHADAAAKGVVWLTVNSGAPGKQGALDAAQATEFAKGNNLSSKQYLLDPTGTVGKLYDAKTTPHMYVIDADSNLVYMGAIDDKPTADQKDIAGATNYVWNAIDSLIAKKPITIASTQAYGCGVKYAN